jgi:2-polyprenyl-6-hydroxyphenyl methylase/3-demethylubiquinone-9 3-methyltransferase
MSIYPYYADATQRYHHKYTLPVVLKTLDGLRLANDQRRVFDLGCGNGSIAAALNEEGYNVIGVDPSEDGIRQAKLAHPDLKVYQGSAYDDLAEQYGQFPVVISLEVVEHIYFPRKYAACIFSLLERGGVAIISTPYHSYWKNLALALTGKLDAHFTALWDYGHIKFWSFKTLRSLLQETGFSSVQFLRVGRIPPIAKSMIAIARK